jgi:hypothetical protein
MNKDLLKILSHSNKDIDNQKLMDYLSNNLTEEERHELEMQMSESGIMADAIEGLGQFKDKQRLQDFAAKLNADLKKQIDKKQKRRNKRKLKEQPWLYFTIVILLFLLVICYVIIRKHLGG